MATFAEQVDEAREQFLKVKGDPQALYDLGKRLPLDVKEEVFRSLNPDYSSLAQQGEPRKEVTKSRGSWLRVVAGLAVAASLAVSFYIGSRVGRNEGVLEGAGYAVENLDVMVSGEQSVFDLPASKAVKGPKVKFRLIGQAAASVVMTPRDGTPSEIVKFQLARGETKEITLPSGNAEMRMFHVLVEPDGEPPRTQALFVQFR